MKTKSRHHWNIFSTLKKESNDAVAFAVDRKICLLSFEIPWEPTAALYEFSMHWWFREWYSTGTRYRFASNPGTLAKFVLTKSRVQFVDRPKVRFKQSVFLAPRQRMSVIEGREVIVSYKKKIRPVIFELSFNFLLHWLTASWLRVTALTPVKSGLG